MMQKLVESLINDLLERPATARTKIGHLLGQFVKRNLLLKKQFKVGLSAVLEFAGDLMVDIPKVWDYFGELIGTKLYILSGSVLYLRVFTLARRCSIFHCFSNREALCELN
jgi:hypothetical protein